MVKFSNKMDVFMKKHPLKICKINQILSQKLEDIEKKYEDKNVKMVVVNAMYIGLFSNIMKPIDIIK